MEDQVTTNNYLSSTSSRAPGQAGGPDVLKVWLGGVRVSRLHVGVPVRGPHFTVHLQISEDPRTTQITLQNQPLGRQREEGPQGSWGPLQPSCCLGFVGLPLPQCPTC